MLFLNIRAGCQYTVYTWIENAKSFLLCGVTRIIHLRNELRAMKVTIILAVLLALILSKGDATNVRGFFFTVYFTAKRMRFMHE